MKPLVAHADWSVDPRKRWVAIITATGQGWTIAAPALVGPVETFLDGLRDRAAGAPVALGVDLPLGVPRAYARLRPEADFPDFLARTPRWADFYRVCHTLEDIGPERPFYPQVGRRGMTRASHTAALGLGADHAALSRLCDRATPERPAGAPVFWTLGANQSGKAAAAAWRDMIVPALAHRDRIRLWPFDGPLRALLAPGHVAIAETYPAEAMRHLSIPTRGSKRRQQDRIGLAEPLREAMQRLAVTPTLAMSELMEQGFGTDAAGEDRLDCTLGALCVLNVVLGHRPDHPPADPWLHRWEGWVLGQTALPAG